MTHHFAPRNLAPKARARVVAKAADTSRKLLLSALLISTIALLWMSLAAPARATEIQRVVSPGGIEAWLVEEHAVPLISVQIAFKGGATQDPDGKEGLVSLMSTLLDEGAGEESSQAFQTRLEDLSINLSFNGGTDSFSGTLKTLSVNRDTAFEMLRLALSEPRFDAEPIDRMRTQAISGLRRSERDPNSIAGRKWFAAAFPGHPYARPSAGTEASLGTITRDDLVAVHRAMIARDTLKIAVVGAIDANTLGPLLDATFGGLPETARLVTVPEVSLRGGQREAIDMDVPQTVIRFGLPGIKRADPDFIPAFIMNHILGGGSFSSRLYEEVREKRGLAYSVWTYLAPYDHTGILMGGTATRAENTDTALEVIMQELRSMAETGPSDEELTKAKSYLTGSYALRFDTSDKIAGQLVGIQMEDLGIDYINKRNSLIEAVTLADVKRLAAKLLDGGSPTIVTVGRSAS